MQLCGVDRMQREHRLSADTSRQFVELRFGDRLVIGDGETIITLEQKTGCRARLRIETDRSVPIEREHDEEVSG